MFAIHVAASAWKTPSQPSNLDKSKAFLVKLQHLWSHCPSNFLLVLMIAFQSTNNAVRNLQARSIYLHFWTHDPLDNLPISRLSKSWF